MVEQFANNASSPLSADINASTTSIGVVSGTLFSASGNFRVVVESEIMLVTARNANTLTVLRGQEGTIAASHTSGTAVTQIMTAGAVQQLKSDTISTTVQTGPYSSLPAAGTAGRIFLPNNGMSLYQDNGTSWNAFGPITPLITPPTVNIGTNFSYYSQNGISSSNGPGTFVVTVPFLLTQGLTGIMQTGSGSGTMFVEAASNFVVTGATAATSNILPLSGVMMVESSTGKYCGVLVGLDFGISSTAATPVVDFSYGQNTTRTSFTRSFAAFSTGTAPFVRLRLTNGAVGNVVGEISVDRQNWIQMGSVATSTAFTSVPNQVGFSVYPWQLNTGVTATVVFYHYNQG